MALAHSPRIVTDGLVLCLDAGNLKSYDKYENLLPYSIVSSTGWSINSSTLTNNATTAPDGTNTAARVQVESTNGFVARLNIPVSAGTAYTFSFWLKSVSGSGTWGINIYDHGGANIGHHRTTVNITEEWQRVSYTYTPTGTLVNVYVSDDRESLATISDGYVWGAQLEKGSSVTDYYATTGTTKTRGSVVSSGIGTLTGTLTNGVGYNSSNLGSLSFDGVDDYVDCGNNLILDVGNNITVNSWFYVSTNSAYQPIAAKVLGDFSLGWEVANSSGTFRVTLRPSATQINLIAGSLSVGNWYMGTMTFDNTTARLYLNGVQTGSTTSGGPVTLNSSQSLNIGRRIQGQYYNGNIAQVSIYNRALTASEIQQNYNALKSRYTT